MISQANRLPPLNGNDGVILRDDHYFMREALLLAEKAALHGEVPVGAVLVHDGQIIASAHNAPISQEDPSAHAEILALRYGAKRLHNYRLPHCTLYVTLEPCCMCAGAMVHARIARLVYGAFDQKTGCIHSQTTLLDQPFHNHRIEHLGGVLADESISLLRNFFQARR